MDEKYLNDPIVSLMKSMGFSDEYIMANVKIEKSENGAAAGAVSYTHLTLPTSDLV
mgnify:CR=1 FL=1